MASEPTNGVPYWGRELSRRIDHLEKLEPAVVANKVDNLVAEVRGMRRAFYTLGFGAIGSSLVFAFSVFLLLGHH